MCVYICLCVYFPLCGLTHKHHLFKWPDSIVWNNAWWHPLIPLKRLNCSYSSERRPINIAQRLHCYWIVSNEPDAYWGRRGKYHGAGYFICKSFYLWTMFYYIFLRRSGKMLTTAAKCCSSRLQSSDTLNSSRWKRFLRQRLWLVV